MLSVLTTVKKIGLAAVCEVGPGGRGGGGERLEAGRPTRGRLSGAAQHGEGWTEAVALLLPSPRQHTSHDMRRGHRQERRQQWPADGNLARFKEVHPHISQPVLVLGSLAPCKAQHPA